MPSRIQASFHTQTHLAAILYLEWTWYQTHTRVVMSLFPCNEDKKEERIEKERRKKKKKNDKMKKLKTKSKKDRMLLTKQQERYVF